MFYKIIIILSLIYGIIKMYEYYKKKSIINNKAKPICKNIAIAMYLNFTALMLLLKTSANEISAINPIAGCRYSI